MVPYMIIESSDILSGKTFVQVFVRKCFNEFEKFQEVTCATKVSLMVTSNIKEQYFAKRKIKLSKII